MLFTIFEELLINLRLGIANKELEREETSVMSFSRKRPVLVVQRSSTFWTLHAKKIKFCAPTPLKE